MTLSWVHHEIAIICILVPMVVFYLYLMKQYFAGKKNTVIGHLTYVLLLLWIEKIIKIVPSLWDLQTIVGITIPPIVIILDIVIAGYVIGILWNLWWGEKDVKLT